MMKTTDEFKRELANAGVSISEWSKHHGFSPALVYQVLTGQRKTIRGESHRIAVAAGLKETPQLNKIQG